MESNDTHHLIERYFDGELDEQELAVFKQKLETDPAFAEAFRLEQTLLDGLEAFGNQQLKSRLEQIHREEATNLKPAGTVPLHPRRWWLAAAVLLGLGILAKLLFEQRQPTPTQLYAMYAVHDFDFAEKGSGDDLLIQAERLLKEKKYTEALPVLETYLGSHSDNAQVLLAKGIALLESGNTAEAVEIFGKIKNGSPLYQNEAIWYLALSSLKTGNQEQAELILSSISPESARAKDANLLLKALRKLKK
jgi:tetratricopeptide (TPR) repeat protein